MKLLKTQHRAHIRCGKANWASLRSSRTWRVRRTRRCRCSS